MKDQILDAVDIVDVVGERVSLVRRGREYFGLCPFHPDKKPSLSVSPIKRIFKCWSCGAGGDVIKFVQLSQRVEFAEALRILARRAGFDDRHTSAPSRSTAERENVRKTLEWARSHFQRNLRRGSAGEQTIAYIRQRGIEDATIERFGLGLAINAWDDVLSSGTRAGVTAEALQLAGLTATSENGKAYDRFRHRLIFPIADGQGRCIAFGGRTLGDDSAKYLNSPETALFSKSRVLYALNLAREAIMRSREAIVVEGYMDAVLLHQHGFENVVATLGTALTDAHVKLLLPLADRIVMCFDSDEAGMRAADRAAETALRHRAEVAVALLGAGEDPADCVIGRGPDALKSLLHSAVSALEFKWNQTVSAYRGDGPRARRDAVERFLEFVSAVSAAGGVDPLEQGLLVRRLAELLSVPAGTVYELLSRKKRTVRREGSHKAPDTSESSAYDSLTRRLPGGLVFAVEELFGLALDDPGLFGSADEALAAGSRHCPVWRELHQVFRSLRDAGGVYDRRDVLARCENEVLCDLVYRAARHTVAIEEPAQACTAAVERVGGEIELLEMENLNARLWQQGGQEQDRADAFAALLDAGRRQHGVLGAGQRFQHGA